MLLHIPIVVLLILQGSHVSNSEISCNHSADTIIKEVVMTARVKAEFMVYNFCDVVNLNLPSGLPDCSPYTWMLLPNITIHPNQVTSPQSGEYPKKLIILNDPSKFGVYCIDHCDNPNEYCGAIAVVPTFDPEELPSCTVLDGKTAQISCISIGYPISSRIMRKDAGSNGKDVCQPINSTTNNATVGKAPFGRLNHTCNNISLPAFGKNEFICEVAFLSWGSNLNHSFTVIHSLYCNATEEDVDGENETSNNLSTNVVDTHIITNSSVSVISNLSNTSKATIFIVTIIPSVLIVTIISIPITVFVIVLIAWKFKCQRNKRESDCTVTEVEEAFTPSEDAQGDRESEERDCINSHVKTSPNFVKYDKIEVRSRRRTRQTQNT